MSDLDDIAVWPPDPDEAPLDVAGLQDLLARVLARLATERATMAHPHQEPQDERREAA